jgi:hypothetical protein
LPKNLSSNPINLHKEVKYELVEPEIAPGTIVEGDMLDAVSSLNFSYNDLKNEKNFSKLPPRKYLKTIIDPNTSFIRVDPQT